MSGSDRQLSGPINLKRGNSIWIGSVEHDNPLDEEGDSDDMFQSQKKNNSICPKNCNTKYNGTLSNLKVQLYQGLELILRS